VNGRRGAVRHDLVGVAAVLWAWAPIVAGIGLFAARPGPLTFAVAFVVTGARQHGLNILAHETWHWTLFRRRAVNDLVGSWALSYPVVMRFESMRSKHFEHHRTVGHADDPDRYYWGWRRDDRGGFVGHMLLVASGLHFVWLAGRSLLGLPVPVVRAGERPRVPLAPRPGDAGRELVRLAIVQLGLLGLFTATVGWARYFLLWVLPLVTLSNLLGELRQFLEHQGGQLLIHRSSPVERFFVAPYNFHLHAVHHAYPAVPWFLVAGREARARARLPEIQVRGSYLRELARYLAGRRPPPAAG
jgi:fatty acid desaturase